jgi:class 3 adenylate cyclase
MSAERHIFLFTDLVGFTALTSEEGDDRAAEVALQLHDHVRRLAPAHGAEEIKTLGDAVMLRCDEPALAVELGLRIVDDLEQVPGFPPVRVGMHTGPAVQRASDWYGATVNVAARLCAAAAGGQVLASQSTCDAAGPLPSVELSDQRLHWLKNVTEPVAARLASRRVPALSERRRCFLRNLLPRRTQEVLS